MIRHVLGMLPRILWKIFFVLNFVIGLVVLYPVFAVLLIKKERYNAAFRLMRFWARWVFHVPGIALKVKREIPSTELPSPCVFVANHSSYLDIVASYLVIPNYFVYMGKAEIEKAPLLRIFFRDMNVYVNRKSRTGSYQAFVHAGEKLKKGQSVFIYPEGTIEAKGQLKPFKNGAFRLAIEHQVPVVPITFKNHWRLLQNGGFFKSYGRPGLAYATIHKPVKTEGMSEADLVSLRHQVRETILNELKKHES